MIQLRPLARLVILLGLVGFGSASPVDAQPLRVDRARSFIDVDVKATVGSFTGRLERYEATVEPDATGKVRSARLHFRFADLKTGNPERDAHLIQWLGGGDPTGTFELGALALAPDGQGQAIGRLTFNGQTRRIEFPVQITRANDTLVISGGTTVDYRQWGLPTLRHRKVVKVDSDVRVRFRLTVQLPPAPDDE
jgi:polyisoprenoid-binding protein YceI